MELALVGRGLGLRLRIGRFVRVALPWILRSTRVSRRFLETRLGSALARA